MNIGIWYYQQCTEVNVYIVGFIYSLYKNTGIDFVFFGYRKSGLYYYNCIILNKKSGKYNILSGMFNNQIMEYNNQPDKYKTNNVLKRKKS